MGPSIYDHLYESLNFLDVFTGIAIKAVCVGLLCKLAMAALWLMTNRK